MRIVAGAYRGRTLTAPAGRETRPTSDRVRESLFALIGPLDGERVLDLFAGSGALGLEALSRGAASATFVDRSAAAVAAVRANSAMVEDAGRVRILRMDWQAALRRDRAAERRYDLCLIDPPYRQANAVAARLGAALSPVLAGGATVVVEYDGAAGPPAIPDLAIAARDDRTYGGTGVAVIRIGTSS